MGAYANVAAALGLELRLDDPGQSAAQPDLPKTIRPADYPQLSALAWQRDSTVEISPREALELYERNWQHLDRDAMTDEESALLQRLVDRLGGGRPLV